MATNIITVKYEDQDYFFKFTNRAHIEWQKGGEGRVRAGDLTKMTTEEEMDYWRCGLAEGDRLSGVEPRFDHLDKFLDHDATTDGWLEAIITAWIDDRKKLMPSEEIVEKKTVNSEG